MTEKDVLKAHKLMNETSSVFIPKEYIIRDDGSILLIGRAELKDDDRC